MNLVEMTKEGITRWFHKLRYNLHRQEYRNEVPDDALVVSNILSFIYKILSQTT
jgi:hypothetical protein